MSLRVLSTLGLALAFALACGGEEAPPATPPAPPAPPVAPPPPPAPPPTGSGDVGVAECDDYIKKMTACLSSMDPAVKAASESAFKQTTDAWRAAAATPEGKAGLAMGCKAALDSIPPTCGTGATGAAPAGAPGGATATAGPGGATATTGGAAVTATAGPGGAAVTAGGTTVTATDGKAEVKTETTTTTAHGSGGPLKRGEYEGSPNDDDDHKKKKKKKKHD